MENQNILPSHLENYLPFDQEYDKGTDKTSTDILSNLGVTDFNAVSYMKHIKSQLTKTQFRRLDIYSELGNTIQ